MNLSPLQSPDRKRLLSQVPGYRHAVNLHRFYPVLKNGIPVPVPVRTPDRKARDRCFLRPACCGVPGSPGCRMLRYPAVRSGRDRSLLTRTRVIFPSLMAMKSQGSQAACTPMTEKPVRSA